MTLTALLIALAALLLLLLGLSAIAGLLGLDARGVQIVRWVLLIAMLVCVIAWLFHVAGINHVAIPDPTLK